MRSTSSSEKGTNASTLVFPGGLGGGKFGDIWTYLLGLPLCAQPTAFPLTAAWTCQNVYEPWRAPTTTTTPTLHIPAYIWGSAVQWWRPRLFYLWVPASFKCQTLCCRGGKHRAIWRPGRWFVWCLHNLLTWWHLGIISNLIKQCSP